MPEIRARHLFDMRLQVSGTQNIGATLNGCRPPEGPISQISEVR